jgi:hypothetical protein
MFLVRTMVARRTLTAYDVMQLPTAMYRLAVDIAS